MRDLDDRAGAGPPDETDGHRPLGDLRERRAERRLQKAGGKGFAPHHLDPEVAGAGSRATG